MKIYRGMELFIDHGANKPEAGGGSLCEIKKNSEKANDWIADVDEMRKIRDGPGKRYTHGLNNHIGH